MWQWSGFDHDLASKLRYEAEMLLLRARCALSRHYRAQIRDLGSRHELRVHLGCGNALLPGWINLDCYPPPPAKGVDILTTDMRRGLPFASESVAAVFSEHFLEHLPFNTVRSTILPEILRVLAPAGRVRIGIPDGEYFIDQYLSYRAGARDPLFESQRAGKTPMMMLNEIAHGFGHHFVYDFSTMAQLLADIGFVNIRHCRPLETAFEEFKGKDRVDAWRNAMTLYVEAEAPPLGP
jgi:predicted SAM-dependent methyltransferase